MKEGVVGQWRVVGVVSAGGVAGSLARFGLQTWWPSVWATLVINVVGCLLIGMLMVVVPRLHRLARPFLGVGVLGGFTTFSGYVVDARFLAGEGPFWLALVYLVGTMAGAVVATWSGVRLARLLTRRWAG
ncbi:fluoride efflux transporter FluC [Nonomuraea endophytica]|uniref:Fluoride-specific ion channel FluC n=1 Tax=Nonomuraea endophytica TaxID=714136 RepID=A0A7W8A8C5_9ACTN|nr:CrcB family protein [Nonomuraea endophytica]MBB5081420.1 CrcB protein [Nonomuraea endophytica]